MTLVRGMAPGRITYLLSCILLFGAAVLPVQAQRETPRAEPAFAEAVQLYEQGLFPEAAAALSSFRSANLAQGLHGQALYLKAKSTLTQGHDELTRRLLDRLQREYPSHPRAQEARLGLAQYYLKGGETEKAKHELQAIASDPRSPNEGVRALFLLGRTAQKRGNLEDAVSYFKQARRNDPQSGLAPAILYATGVAQVQLRQYDQATAAFEQLGTEYPDSKFSQNLGTILGETYYRVKRYEEAASELQKRVSELDGSNRARALYLLGESYSQLKENAKAVDTYRQLLEEHPQSSYAVPAQYGLAWRFYAMGKHEAAAQTFSEVRQSTSSLSSPATYYEAVNRALTGQYTNALQLYRTFLDARPEDRLATEARYEIGLIHYRKQRFEEAAEAFRSVVQASNSSERLGQTYYWLGNALLANEQLDRALEAYDEAISRGAAPPSIQSKVLFQKAWTLYQDQQYAEAASEFESLNKSHPEASRGQEALLWAADSYYRQENYDRARTLLRRLLSNQPEGKLQSAAHYALAWAHFQERNFEQSARRFRQFLASYDGGNTEIPYRQDAQLRLGDSYFALKRYEDAMTAYQKVRGTGEDYAVFQTGKALYYGDRLSDALETLRQFVQQYPESPWRPNALYRIADIHFQQEDYAAAREGFRRLLTEYPNHALAPEAQYAIADAHYNAGEMQAAVESYRRVLETYPNSPPASEAASSLFFALNATGQQDRAESLIDSIAANSPNPNIADQLRFHRARAAYQTGQSKQALKLFRAFVRTSSLDSRIPEAYYYLGLLYADRDQYTEAKNYLSRLVDQYPRSDYFAEGALRLGEIYLTQEQYKRAEKVYESAAANQEIDKQLRAQARYGQSVALLRLDRIEEAETLLSKMLETNETGPLQASARLGLGRIREQQGRISDARRLYETVVESVESETGAEALYRLGHLLRTQNQPRQAIEELDRMPSLFAGYPEWEARALLEQARAYRDLGNPGQAVQQYNQVLKLHSGTPFAETAREEKESITSTS